MCVEMGRFLLVEDDDRDVELTLNAFAKARLESEVTVVRDGEEALDLLNRRGKFEGLPPGNPDLVLLDIKMPKVGGLEVLREIRESEHLKMIPVIVLTTSRDAHDISESYELGISAYIAKPVDFQKFVEAVRKIGLLWGALNEPPPGNPGRRRLRGSRL